jgi:hypothetical protein
VVTYVGDNFIFKKSNILSGRFYVIPYFFEPKTAREAPVVKFLLKGSEKSYKAKQQKGRDNKLLKENLNSETNSTVSCTSIPSHLTRLGNVFSEKLSFSVPEENTLL